MGMQNQYSISIEPKTATELIKTTNTIDYLAAGLFPRKNISMLFGEAGIGKTWLLLDVAFCLGGGIPIFNEFRCKPLKVLIFEGDMPNEILKERLELMSCKLNNNVSFISRFDYDDLSFSTLKGQLIIKNEIEDIKPDLVIFDTLIR